MANLGGFKREDAPEDEFSPLAAGTYDVMICETGMHPYKSGNGEMLKVTYEVIGEKGKGRKIFDYMNLWHPTSEKSAKISWTQMGKILDAVGKVSVDDSDDLCNIPFAIDVVIDGDNNSIKKWHPKAGHSAPASSGKSAPAADEKPADDGKEKAPWEK